MSSNLQVSKKTEAGIVGLVNWHSVQKSNYFSYRLFITAIFKTTSIRQADLVVIGLKKSKDFHDLIKSKDVLSKKGAMENTAN